MPKAQNHKGYSCRVDILKYVKVADKWRFAPAQTQNNKLKQDWVLVDGSPERHAEGAYYIEWYENGVRRRQSVQDSGAVLEQARRKAIELDASKAGIEMAESEEGQSVRVHDALMRTSKRSSRRSVSREPTRLTSTAWNYLPRTAVRPIFTMLRGRTFSDLSASYMNSVAGRVPRTTGP